MAKIIKHEADQTDPKTIRVTFDEPPGPNEAIELMRFAGIIGDDGFQMHLDSGAVVFPSIGPDSPHMVVQRVRRPVATIRLL